MGQLICVEQLVFFKHSFSRALIGPCEGYVWVYAQAESMH